MIEKLVEVKPASSKKVSVPARYETLCRQVLDTPAKKMFKKLKVYAGSDHRHAAQNPVPADMSAFQSSGS